MSWFPLVETRPPCILDMPYQEVIIHPVFLLKCSDVKAKNEKSSPCSLPIEVFFPLSSSFLFLLEDEEWAR
jgi:hypothetical protein